MYINSCNIFLKHIFYRGYNLFALVTFNLILLIVTTVVPCIPLVHTKL